MDYKMRNAGTKIEPMYMSGEFSQQIEDSNKLLIVVYIL